MQKNDLPVLRLMILCTVMFELQGFSPFYNGNDPYESFASLGNDPRFFKEDYINYFPYYKQYHENISLIDTANIDVSKLPYPYNTLSNIEPYNPAGYYLNWQYIAKLFASNNIVNAIEIGSDYGLSTRHIASLLPKNGKLYAIDTWDFTNYASYHNQRYIPFLSNVVHAGLTDIIIPVKKASQDAIEIFKLFRLSFDMIFIDGDHETEAVLRDLELYYPLLDVHGVMCGDDWMLKTVRAAIVQFAQKNNLTIYGACNFWFLKNEGQYAIKSLLEASDEIWKF
ncbi:MAG TPA: class I SAM-dependent methyltransferase [Candidatus Saccharimonadales bacterium]|nr:class I SAM-dependent methyltransferase [Candidatus Saccharimonadales bacterium]